MDLTAGTECQTQVTGLPEASLLTVLKQCRKKEYRILTPLLFISNLWLWAPTIWAPWFPMEGRQFLKHELSVLSSLPTWGLKLSFYFLQPVFVLAYSAPNGQRKPRFWWQHYHQQLLQLDTNNYSHFTSESQLRYCNWEGLILSSYWICFCDFLILPLLLL